MLGKWKTKAEQSGDDPDQARQSQRNTGIKEWAKTRSEIGGEKSVEYMKSGDRSPSNGHDQS